jgi:hypothetical protein
MREWLAGIEFHSLAAKVGPAYPVASSSRLPIGPNIVVFADAEELNAAIRSITHYQLIYVNRTFAAENYFEKNLICTSV